HEVHRGHGIDVVEGEHVVVLVHLAARDLARNDLAEDAVRVGHGAFPFVREAFSSRPERPSRRSSSASTSPNAMPCQESMTMQWKMRSAVSCTIEPRSPLFEAITVSTASSATFLRIWSCPWAWSEATYDGAGSAPSLAASVASRRSSESRSAIAGRLGCGEHRIGLDPAPRVALAFEPVEEAAPAPGVARDSRDRFHAEQHRVGVAIEAHLEHALHVAR